jgi:4-hydroxy-tetrahydrodipicolinate reductase
MPDIPVIALFGGAGKMGREILALTPRYPAFKIGYGYDKAAHGERIGPIAVAPEPESLAEDVRLVIDFSAAPAVLDHLELALNRRAGYLCGITGLESAIMQELRASANEIPVLYSPNMSPAMNYMFVLAAEAARTFPEYSRHIIETHHERKLDAPSGTALRLADAVYDAVQAETPISSLRMGDVTGEHTIIFGGPGERLEITHRADSRAVFASGALRAADWLLHKSAGYYTMADVLHD